MLIRKTSENYWIIRHLLTKVYRKVPEWRLVLYFALEDTLLSVDSADWISEEVMRDIAGERHLLHYVVSKDELVRTWKESESEIAAVKALDKFLLAHNPKRPERTLEKLMEDARRVVVVGKSEDWRPQLRLRTNGINS